MPHMLKELCRILSAFMERRCTISEALSSLKTICKREKTLATPTYRVIIIFTYNPLYASTQNDLCQISSPLPKWHLKFPGPGGSGSPFFGGGLFRCARFSSGQIRTREGLAGLIGKKRGPKGRHKLSAEIMAFVEQSRTQDPSLRVAALLELIQKRFGTRVHRRTLERALVAAKKNLINHH